VAGFAQQRLSYRGEELVNGRNPKAVDQMGLSVLLAFRRKVFLLAVVQCAVVMALAWAIANVPLIKGMRVAYSTDNLMRDGILIAGSWLLALVSLVALSVVRHSYPQNMAGLAVFTICISVAIALLAGPNIHLGLGIILLGFVLTGLLTSLPLGGKVVEVFPVACLVVLVTNALCLVWHFTFNTFIGLFWVVLLMFMNTVAVCWAGYQLDFLSSRLMVDEYLLPVILMWAELMVAMLLMFSIEALSSNLGECGDSCYMWGHTTWHCDCWIYSDGTHGSDRHRRQRTTQAAPSQEEMPGAPGPEALGASAV
jgi:hypothetical protein